MVIQLTVLERLLHRLHLLPTPVMDAFGGVLFGRVLAIGVRRGLFEELADGPQDVTSLAGRTGLAPESVALMAKACVVGGYLRVEGREFALAPEGRKWLLRDSLTSLTNLICYFEALHHRWGSLERSLERGRPDRPYYDAFTENDWRVYVLAMRDLARLLAPGIVGQLRFPAGASTLVDIGGSHAFYAIECCRRHPDLHAVVLDLPAATVEATRLIKEAGMEGRIRTEAGDFMHRPLPSPADGMLMFNIIHGLTVDQNHSLMQAALAALRPGGRLYVLDQMNNGRRQSGLGRFIPLMVGLNLLNEIGGRCYDVREVKEWCSSASSFKFLRQPMPGLTLLEVTR